MTKLRELLSHRLRVLMEATPALDTQTKVSKKAKVSQSTVQRILSKDVAATVDVIEDLGRAFGLKPPSLILSEEKEAELLKVWLDLNELDQSEVQRFALMLAQRGTKPTQPRLDFEVRREVPLLQKVANMRASARPTSDENEKCPPSVTTRIKKAVNSPPASNQARRIRKG